jgi:amino acid permease
MKTDKLRKTGIILTLIAIVLVVGLMIFSTTGCNNNQEVLIEQPDTPSVVARDPNSNVPKAEAVK